MWPCPRAAHEIRAEIHQILNGVPGERGRLGRVLYKYTWGSVLARDCTVAQNRLLRLRPEPDTLL